MALTPQEELELLELEEAEYQHQKRQASGGVVPGDITKKFAQGASFGFLPRVAGALEAGGQAIGLKGLGGTDLTDIEFQKPFLLEPEKLGAAYETAKTGYEKALDLASQRSPITSGIAEFAGGMMSPGSPLKGAGLAEKAIRGAGAGAIAGYGYSREDEDKLGRMGIGAVIGGAAPVVLEKAISPGIAKVGSAAGKLKDVLSTWGEQFKTMPKADSEDIIAASKALGFEPSKAMLSHSKQIASLEEGLAKGGGAFATDVVKKQHAIQEGIRKATEKAGSLSSERSSIAIGEDVSSKLAQEAESIFAPSKELYQSVSKELQNTPINPDVVNKAFAQAKKIGLFRTDQGRQFLDQIKGEVSEASDIPSLMEYTRRFWQKKNPMGTSEQNNYIDALYGTLKSIRDNSINAMKSDPSIKAVGKKGIQAVDEVIDNLVQADALHEAGMKEINQISSLFGTRGKKFASPKQFQDLLSEKTFEDLGKQSGSAKASTLIRLKATFPETFEKVREAQINNILEASKTKGDVDLGKVIRQLKKYSPEAKDLLFDEETKAMLSNMEAVYNAIPGPINPSNTSGMQRFWQSFTHPTKAAQDYLANKALNEAGPEGSPFMNEIINKFGGYESKMKPGGSIYQTPSSFGEKIPRVIQPMIKTEEKKHPDQTSIMEKVKGSKYEQVLQNALQNGGEQSFAAANYVLKNRDQDYRKLFEEV